LADCCGRGEGAIASGEKRRATAQSEMFTDPPVGVKCVVICE
jgi:hypothetical protein